MKIFHIFIVLYCKHKSGIMKIAKAILIYKCANTYLPTIHPALYFGAPDKKVYVIYALTYETPMIESGLEFVIARLEEFMYDYKENRLIDLISDEKQMPLLNHIIEKPNQKMKIIEISRVVKSFMEAEILLNKFIRLARDQFRYQ